MINFKKYIDNHFKPLDVIGTTSFGVTARAIWMNTWGRKKVLSWFSPYWRRANCSTHTAITCLGKDGRKWLMEMDNTKSCKRFVSEDLKSVLLPEEFELIEHSLKSNYHEINVFSGIKLTKPEDYYTDNIYNPHVCWIGRYPYIDYDRIQKGNEWLFDKYREGVPYDYVDIIALWNIGKRIDILGSSNVYVCSELVQRCYEAVGLLTYSEIPMTPQEWQEHKMMTEVVII